jgi:hypothetical protein
MGFFEIGMYFIAGFTYYFEASANSSGQSVISQELFVGTLLRFFTEVNTFIQYMVKEINLRQRHILPFSKCVDQYKGLRIEWSPILLSCQISLQENG